jgi:hypothetical protein
MSKAKWDQIQALDLTNIKANLYRRQKSWLNRRWWRKYMNHVEYDYKKFLYLICAFPSKKIVPWGDRKGFCPLDELWHEHILDTKKYAADCEAIFGRFIHHDPNLPQGSTDHTNHWQETMRLHRESFRAEISTVY